jgi:hypothetical protein
MTANPVLAHLFRPRPKRRQTAAAVLESEQVIRLSPTLTADDLPAGFEEILEVQVLGYRERLTRLAEAAGSTCSTLCGRLFPNSRQCKLAHTAPHFSGSPHTLPAPKSPIRCS